MQRLPSAAAWLLVACLGSNAISKAQQFELYHVAGSERDSRFGADVATIGDVDQDGIEDFVVGAPDDGSGGFIAGRVSLHSGVDGALLHDWLGASPSQLGSAVAAAPDLDGDGLSDVLVGAPFEVDAATGWVTGAAYVYSSATGALLRSFFGSSDAEYFGDAVSGIGDVDADGVGDVIVGAPRADHSKVDAGSAWLFSGASGATIGRVDGIGKTDHLGIELAALGDVDGDDVPDFAVGAPRHDSSAIPNAGIVLVHSGATLARLYWIEGDQREAQLGSALASGADLDGDGIHDLLVGVPNWSGALGKEGVVRACSGVDGALLWERTGLQPDDRLGGEVAIADPHGVGSPTVLVAAAVDGGVVYPRVELLAPASGTPKYAWYVRNPQHGLHGRALAVLDDVNGDGHPDFLVGAPERDDGSHTWTGLVHVYPGSDFWLHVEPKHPWFGGTVETSIGEGMPGHPALRVVVALNGTPTFVPLLPVVLLDGGGFFTSSETVPPGLSGLAATLRAFAVPASGPLAVSNEETIVFL